jgi:hypothetical protein
MATTAKTTGTAKPAETTETATPVQAPKQATAMEALTKLYSLKAANRHAMLTVLAVEEPQLFVELAGRAK